jgi:hypothetical protein
MAAMTSLRFCGQRVTVEELDLIKETVRDCSGLSRTELAFTICELLEWRRPNGGLKGHECRQFLEELDEQGVLQLPEFKGSVRSYKGKPKPDGEDPFKQSESLSMALHEAGPVELEVVETPEARRQWREWVDRYHYLGCKVPFGAHLRYFVRLTRPQPQRVGCVQFSSPAWMMAPRDQWIGWDHAQRTRRLQWIVQNSRFLIVPWVHVPYLASATLARMARKIPADWEARYAIRPVLMETLVDLSRFRGTCYRAANWISLGQTTGRGRMDRKHTHEDLVPKEVLVYPLCRKFRQKLLEA